MSKKKYKNDGYTISGCVTLGTAAGANFIASAHSTSPDGWCIDYDPETDMCFTYFTDGIIDDFCFEV